MSITLPLPPICHRQAGGSLFKMIFWQVCSTLVYHHITTMTKLLNRNSGLHRSPQFFTLYLILVAIYTPLVKTYNDVPSFVARSPLSLLHTCKHRGTSGRSKLFSLSHRTSGLHSSYLSHNRTQVSSHSHTQDI